MVVLINLAADLARLKTMQGLTPQTALTGGEGFAPLAPYRDSTIFAIKSKCWRSCRRAYGIQPVFLMT